MATRMRQYLERKVVHVGGKRTRRHLLFLSLFTFTEERYEKHKTPLTRTVLGGEAERPPGARLSHIYICISYGAVSSPTRHPSTSPPTGCVAIPQRPVPSCELRRVGFVVLPTKQPRISLNDGSSRPIPPASHAPSRETGLPPASRPRLLHPSYARAPCPRCDCCHSACGPWRSRRPVAHA
jgi:hypothetical protein